MLGRLPGQERRDESIGVSLAMGDYLPDAITEVYQRSKLQRLYKWQVRVSHWC